jgi:hypothetical protein
MLTEGVAWERLRAEVSYDKRWDFLEILDDPDQSQALFGKLTGRCGCCGKTLTDPNSKMRGIGPECAGLR